MLLYYGADRMVEKPIYNYGNPSNDYGLGFYLTNDKEIAKLWASRYANGYLLTYDIDFKVLQICNLQSSNEKEVLTWLSILVANRFSKEEYEDNKNNIDWLINNYKFNPNDYDVIIGYCADDSYFQYSRDFVANQLSFESLSEAMRIGKLGIQYVLKSRKAFEKITLVNYEKVEQTDDYALFRNKALEDYKKLKKIDKETNTFLRDIMRKSL